MRLSTSRAPPGLVRHALRRPGGSKTMATSTLPTPGTRLTAFSTQPGISPATGQPGAVSVMSIVMLRSSSMSTCRSGRARRCRRESRVVDGLQRRDDVLRQTLQFLGGNRRAGSARRRGRGRGLRQCRRASCRSGGLPWLHSRKEFMGFLQRLGEGVDLGAAYCTWPKEARHVAVSHSGQAAAGRNGFRRAPRRRRGR